MPAGYKLATHARIENLLPGERYQFYVLASNIIGRAELSEPSTSVHAHTEHVRMHAWMDRRDKIRGLLPGQWPSLVLGIPSPRQCR